jgi:hypothetical protein
LATTGGNVGVGTTSPYAKLSVSGSGVFDNNILASYFTATSTTATSTFRGGAVFGYNNSALSNFGETLDVLGSFAVENPAGTDNFFVGTNGFVGVGTTSPYAKFSVHADTTGTYTNTLFAVASSSPTATTTHFVILSNGNVGIGTTSPYVKLSVTNTAASPQARFSYDATNYAELTVNSVGDLVIGAQGGDINFLNENLRVCALGACPTDPSGLSGTGNILAEGTIFADAFSPVTCPTGMIPVPASPADGRQGFCVDKYEASGATTSPPIRSQLGDTPLVSITQTNARAACIVAGKHLITEKEWLAIAHNAENVGWNWNGGVAGTNQMSDGHSDNSPASALATAADTSPCSGTGQTCDTSTWNTQRRTYKLSNGEYIWDFGGNVWEWVDQTVVNDYPIVNSATAGSQVCSTAGDGICGNTRTTNDQWYRGGFSTIAGFVRSGGWSNGVNTGAFLLYLFNAPSAVYTTVGFRCAR